MWKNIASVAKKLSKEKHETAAAIDDFPLRFSFVDGDEDDVAYGNDVFAWNRKNYRDWVAGNAANAYRKFFLPLNYVRFDFWRSLGYVTSLGH